MGIKYFWSCLRCLLCMEFKSPKVIFLCFCLFYLFVIRRHTECPTQEKVHYPSRLSSLFLCLSFSVSLYLSLSLLHIHTQYVLFRPDWTILGRINSNMETVLFREKFTDWPDKTRVIGKTSSDQEPNLEQNYKYMIFSRLREFVKKRGFFYNLR